MGPAPSEPSNTARSNEACDAVRAACSISAGVNEADTPTSAPTLTVEASAYRSQIAVRAASSGVPIGMT